MSHDVGSSALSGFFLLKLIEQCCDFRHTCLVIQRTVGTGRTQPGDSLQSCSHRIEIAIATDMLLNQWPQIIFRHRLFENTLERVFHLLAGDNVRILMLPIEEIDDETE